jgi:hypothetical protein
VSIDGFVDTESASRLLGVSVRRVNQLAESGDIAKAARGLYDRISIERHLAVHRGSGKRAWDATTAWAAIAILSGRQRQVDWLAERSKYRLEAGLRRMTAVELVANTRDRASVHVFRGHPSVAEAVRDSIIVRDWQMLGLAGEANEGADGYLAATDLDAVIRRYGLAGSSSGNIVLRATDFDMTTVRSLARAGDVLIALDAAGEVDVRTRRVGELVLERALDRFREMRERRL